MSANNGPACTRSGAEPASQAPSSKARARAMSAVAAAVAACDMANPAPMPMPGTIGVEGGDGDEAAPAEADEPLLRPPEARSRAKFAKSPASAKAKISLGCPRSEACTRARDSASPVASANLVSSVNSPNSSSARQALQIMNSHSGQNAALCVGMQIPSGFASLPAAALNVASERQPPDDNSPKHDQRLSLGPRGSASRDSGQRWCRHRTRPLPRRSR
mmetsp:Transcript_119914/g.346479  ORF Transcript_119914/g.346479 Transcript_119914/m.346479 type:complete len:218 (+) Transcript_119914:496-1149(+)